MSTPADRLRKKAEAAKQEQESREREERLERIKQEQSLRTRQSRVYSLSQMILNRTENLARATGTNMRISLDPNQREGGDPEFRISIGHKYWIKGVLGEGGWRATIHGPSGQFELNYVNDNDFDRQWDSLVEPLIEQTMQAVIRGEESPY